VNRGPIAGAQENSSPSGPVRVQNSGPQENPPAPDEDVSVFPIPAITMVKNEGMTYGLIAAILFPDAQGEVDKFLALDLAYRKTVKMNGFVDFRYYLGPVANLEAYSYWAQKVENENEIYYDDRWLGDAFAFRAEFDESRSTTDRFFGKGANTPKAGESVYTANNYQWLLRFGPNLSEEIALQGTFRVRHFREGRGLVERVPQMQDRYPGEFGIQGGLVTAEGIRMSYENRDNLDTPTRGEYGNVFVEVAQYASHRRTLPFQVFGIEAGKLWPLGEDAQFVTVAHFRARFTHGPAPFWELSSLGGALTLRSFGLNRFKENNFWVLNFEERIRCFTLRLEGIVSEMQLAPFFDLGEVCRVAQDFVRPNAARRLHWSGGLGFRAVIHPYVVGRVDAAYGTEGVGVSVGIDYPF
jgi:outer membrane protein assembly factor BamA